MNNELRMAAFGAYPNATAIGQDERNPHFPADTGKIVELAAYKATIDNNGEYYEFIPDEVKLLLTPLSRITDEHAIEVAKLADISEAERKYRHGWNDYDNYERIGKEIAQDLIEDYGDPCKVGAKNAVAIVDYLRSKSYLLPFRGVDLIAAGIAVEKGVGDE